MRPCLYRRIELQCLTALILLSAASSQTKKDSRQSPLKTVAEVPLPRPGTLPLLFKKRVQVWCQTIATVAITGGCRVFLLLLWRAVTARAMVRTTHKAKRTTSQRVTVLLWSFQFFLPTSLFLRPARLSEWGVRFPFSEMMLFMGQWHFPVESLKKR